MARPTHTKRSSSATKSRHSKSTRSAKAGTKAKAVLSPRAKGSSLAQKGTRVFALGVQHVLRAAAKRHTPVAVQGPNGDIVRAVPSRQGGAFVVVNEGRTSPGARKRGSSAKRSAR